MNYSSFTLVAELELLLSQSTQGHLSTFCDHCTL